MNNTSSLMGCTLFMVIVITFASLIIFAFLKHKKVFEYVDSLAATGLYTKILPVDPEFNEVNRLIMLGMARLSAFNTSISVILKRQYEGYILYLVNLDLREANQPGNNRRGKFSVLIKMNTGLDKGFFVRKKLPGFAEKLISSLMGNPAVIPDSLPGFNAKFVINKAEQQEVSFFSRDLQKTFVSLCNNYPFHLKAGTRTSSDSSGISFFSEGIFIFGSEIENPEQINELIESSVRIAESAKTTADRSHTPHDSGNDEMYIPDM